jgi:transcriptional regulator with XRE-family HTH domain
MNSRILLILKTKDISASKFADEIGVQRSSISHILSGRNNPSLDFIQKTLSRFPDISPDWILTGKGSMYLEPDLFNSIEEHKEVLKPKTKEIFNSERDNIIKNGTKLESDNNELVKPQKPKQSKTSEKIADSDEKILKSQEIKLVNKKIERIIIFYSDKSCIEYIPD